MVSSVKVNFILSSLYQVFSIITPLITAPYVSRILGAYGIGVFSYTSSIQMYFSIFAALGITGYGVREIACRRNNIYEYSIVFWEIQILKFCTSFICLIIWGIFVYLNKQYTIIYIILTMNLLSVMLDISWFYYGLEQFKYIVLRNTIIRILEVILIFVLIQNSRDLNLYICLMSVGTLLGAVSLWFTLPKFLMKVNLNPLRVFSHLKGCFIYFIPTIATSLYTICDKILIGVITDNQNQNGYYEQANKVIGILKAIVFSSINLVLESRNSFLFTEKKYDEVKRYISLSINYILFMGFGCCFGILGVASNFVPLFFGDGYEPVIPLLKLLSPVILIIGISNCLGSQYYSPAGMRSKSSVYIVIGAVVNVVCNIILIPFFESIGAVIGTIISELLITILYLVFCDDFLTIKQLLSYSWKKLLAGLFMFFIIIIFENTNYNPVLTLIIQIITGSIIYVFLLFIMNDMLVKDIIFRKLLKGNKSCD